MKITPYALALILLDAVLTNLDRFWATDTAAMQFFVYDIATFGRIALLAITQGIFMLFWDRLRVRRIDSILWGLYWAYALYTFKLWLDIQSSFVHG